jgi:hypothetical protein
MIDSVTHYDGYVVQSTGDGIFALFGAPAAYEDHPQRAVYAVLRMQEELRRYSAKLVDNGIWSRDGKPNPAVVRRGFGVLLMMRDRALKLSTTAIPLPRFTMSNLMTTRTFGSFHDQPVRD